MSESRPETAGPLHHPPPGTTDRGLPRTLVLAGESPLPPHSGLRLRVLHLARELARSSQVDLAVLGAAEAAPSEPFRLSSIPHDRSRASTVLRSFRTPYAVAKRQSAAMASLAARPEWSSVQVESAAMVPAASRARVPVVLDAYDVESELLGSVADSSSPGPARLRLRWEQHKTRRFERQVSTQVSAVCTTSDADAEVFEGWGAREVVVVPNGVDTVAIAYRPPAASGAELLYVGHLGYQPNAAAARELAADVLPLVRDSEPEACVRLVGRDSARLASLASPHVELLGEVPDVLPELRRARAVVLPLRAGSGTRLKVLEAMAAGAPVVATPFAVTGISVRDGEHVLLGATPRELAAQVVRICRDEAFAASLSRNARELVERSYDWSIAGQPLRALHERLTARRSTVLNP